MVELENNLESIGERIKHALARYQEAGLITSLARTDPEILEILTKENDDEN